jgi:hypothetical protein
MNWIGLEEGSREAFLDEGSKTPILKIICYKARQSVVVKLVLGFVISYTQIYIYIYILVQRRLILSHTYTCVGEFITHYVRPSRDRDRIPLEYQFLSVLTRLIGHRNPATGERNFLRSTGALFCIDTAERSRKSQWLMMQTVSERPEFYCVLFCSWSPVTNSVVDGDSPKRLSYIVYFVQWRHLKSRDRSQLYCVLDMLISPEGLICTCS